MRHHVHHCGARRRVAVFIYRNEELTAPASGGRLYENPALVFGIFRHYLPGIQVTPQRKARAQIGVVIFLLGISLVVGIYCGTVVHGAQVVETEFGPVELHEEVFLRSIFPAGEHERQQGCRKYE